MSTTDSNLGTVQAARAEALSHARAALVSRNDYNGGTHSGNVDPHELVYVADWIIHGSPDGQVADVLAEWHADVDSEPSRHPPLQLCEKFSPSGYKCSQLRSHEGDHVATIERWSREPLAAGDYPRGWAYSYSDGAS